ncbi:hypothetical protein TrLO_g13178 [Triparma laevis f. longispina]|uniref:T4 RNA ligase 1-like N-terminal domain-containing protein n=1 Tax=Triparma laevis f. longispina TaxID=1714387 RepID=A0A9W7CDY2_9STRA|nr:hypothetical protein TrLO_g13178 [Triparma laevis f. longispina]
MTDLTYSECLSAVTSPQTHHHPVTTLASFLPKFENDAEDMKKVHNLLQNHPTSGVLLTLKHSGSLLLVTGLAGKLATFSKNSTANDYTAVMDRILSATVLPEHRLDLAHYLEEHNLSLSFEAVSPALMGDHGDRPNVPYLLLTSVHKGDSPLGLDQVIEIAARFSLIPNEMWWIGPTSSSEEYNTSEYNTRTEVLNGLSKKRNAEYTEAREYLDKHAQLVVAPPLRHGELQGEILEGFVVFVVEIPPDKLENIFHLNKKFASYREPLLERLVELGAQLLKEEAGGLDPPKRLPEFLEWEGERGITKESEVAEVLTILATERDAVMFSRLPPEDISVRFLKHGTRYFMILHVKKDEVFANYYEKWGGEGGARLNRGHVFSLIPPSTSTSFTSFTSQITIRGTVKWKLLPYISRTFGNRNCLKALVGSKNKSKIALTGYNPFMKAVERFFTNWRVDAAYCKLHREKMSDWARFVMGQNSAYKDMLRDGSYLTPFREFEKVRREGTLGEQQNIYPEPVIIVIDLEPEITLTDGEIELNKGECLEPGQTYRTNRPTPGMGKLMSVYEPKFVLVVPDPPANAKRAKATTKACLKKQRLEAIVDDTEGFTRLKLLIDDDDEDFEVREEGVVVNGGEPIKVFSTLSDAKEYAELKEVDGDDVGGKNFDGRQVRRIVATLCCPPGTGKSTILKGVASKLNAGMVSSDDFIGESSRNSFEEAFIKLVEDNKVVVYDKNIPDGDGLARLLGRHVMGNARVVKRFAVEYIFIVPRMLTDVDVEVAKTRIACRDKEDGRAVLGVWLDAFFEIFADYVRNCRRFLSEAQCMRGVMITSKFYSGDAGAASSLIEDAASFVENCTEPFVVDTNAGVKTKYWGVELSPPPSDEVLMKILEGTGYGVDDLVRKRLHVTLAFAPKLEQENYWNDRQNVEMKLKVSGVAWDDQALALYLNPEFKIPLNEKKTPHVTIALKGGASAYHSNVMLAGEHERMSVDLEISGFVTRVVNEN